MTNLRAFGKLLLVPIAVASLVALLPRTSQSNAQVFIVNGNAPGVGFNDPTPAAPVGGNPGTTKGQQALNVFQAAADIWGATLDSNVPIYVLATFEPLSCNATQAVLGSAGTIFIFANFVPAPNFPGPLGPNLWHSSAESDKRAGYDLNPFNPSDPANTADIRARFNSNLGNAGCLTGIFWYYGFDANHGNNIDLLTVVLHELGHGMGFQQFASTSTGTLIQGLPDVYNRNLFDATANKTWDVMTNGERVASAINTGKVTWRGSVVTANVPAVLLPGTPLLTISTPPSVAGNYGVGTAFFAPPLSSPGVTGDLVLADDGVAPNSNGCEPIVNSVSGKIAVIDRGTCTFYAKALNAQQHGAIGVIIVNNVAGSPAPGLGGGPGPGDPAITIPVASVTLPDGNALKTAMAGGTVTGTLGVNLAVLAGADADGFALINAPNPLQPGSSISHWDPIAFRNLLMEPAINGDLTHNLTPPNDLTLPLMRDIGWYPDADLDGLADDIDCNPNSDLRATVQIEDCDSGVPNTLFSNGCTISDLIGEAAGESETHGHFVSRVTQLTKTLVRNGTITDAQRESIIDCAAGSQVGKIIANGTPSKLGGSNVPDRFGVKFAGANPSRDGAKLQLAIPSRTSVAVRVLDLRGSVVWAMDRRDFEPGRHNISWNGQDASGRTAAPGVYFIQVVTPENSTNVRFVLIH